MIRNGRNGEVGIIGINFINKIAHKFQLLIKKTICLPRMIRTDSGVFIICIDFINLQKLM